MKLQRKHETLRQSIRRLVDLKEVRLEKGALQGEYDRTTAIFSLRQLGWRDNPDDRDNGDKVVIIDDL